MGCELEGEEAGAAADFEDVEVWGRVVSVQVLVAGGGREDEPLEEPSAKAGM